MDDQTLLQIFPQLDSGFEITSPYDPFYNCIAWAARDDVKKWWWPEGGYWPRGVSRAVTVESFCAAFATLGYRPCRDGRYQMLYEKVVLYVNQAGEPTHMARQLIGGKWTSKLGKSNDIAHVDVSGVEGTSYGVAFVYLRRPILYLVVEKLRNRLRRSGK